MDRDRMEKKEKIFTGIPASPGIAFGEAFVVNIEDLPIGDEPIGEEDVEPEIGRFEEALRQTEGELADLSRTLEEEMGREHAKILDSHILMLSDEVMGAETVQMIRGEKISAACAFHRVLDRTLRTFDQMKDQYLRERAEDIRDVRRRVLRNLLGQKVEGLANLRKQAIVVARNLTPSDTMGFKRKYVLAFVSDIGGSTSHAAIMARSHGIPAVVGVDGLSAQAKPYDRIIVDGISGEVILNPTAETERLYRQAQERFRELEIDLLTLKDYPAVTLDGRKIELSGNVENEEEIDDLTSHGARGIGLLRTEYFFIGRGTLPGEEEQFRFYRDIVRRIAPDPVIIRTLDIGGDKIAAWVDDAPEANPFMGWRGIRFTLSRKDIFRTQLRAIYRASAYGTVRIMFPMVSVLDEVLAAKAICAEVVQDLQRERYRIGERVEIGIMIETPSAVAVADHLAREVDFFSIGSNDLVQYTLAVDRGNNRIAYLYDELHPSIIRLIHETVEAAHRNKIWAGLCGEMTASAGVYGTLLLIGAGLDELSAQAFLIPEIKKIIRSVTFDETRTLLKNVLKRSTAGE
ncbi:MAG: phosphoenolpyruvate--protein phosphotransferase, partial [Candidatus Krumholzibacteria bacterium]|nr:phosphoenolpyruvate--protein phosphotransferase [Candidatus Krumholzibacteria bacterium]